MVLSYPNYKLKTKVEDMKDFQYEQTNYNEYISNRPPGLARFKYFGSLSEDPLVALHTCLITEPVSDLFNFVHLDDI